MAEVNSDVEAIMILPQLFAAFCAKQSAEAPEILKATSDLSPDAESLPGPTVNLNDLFSDLATGVEQVLRLWNASSADKSIGDEQVLEAAFSRVDGKACTNGLKISGFALRLQRFGEKRSKQN